MNILAEAIVKGYSYEQYRSLIDGLLAKNMTTGSNQSEQLQQFTLLNQSRMNRVEKTFRLNAELENALKHLNQPMVWLVLTEAWCGDAAQNLPAIEAIAKQSNHIETRYILRDENLLIMDNHLTNGGRSIPKLIALKADNLKELGTWGPRPQEIQQLFLAAKQSRGFNKEDFSIEMHKWYAKNRSVSIQKEFSELVPAWAEKAKEPALPL